MDENQQQPAGDNPIPPPPPPEIGVRTMQSDLQSMQKSGGDAPQPYIINADSAAPQRPVAEPMPAPQQPKITAQGYTGPEAPIFQEPSEPVFTPAEQIPTPGTANNDPTKKSGGLKIIIWIIAIIAIAGGLGALGYFVIFPILFPTQIAPIAQEPEPQPAPTPTIPEPVIPTPEPEPIITEPTTTAEIVPPPTPEIKPHTSFFQTSTSQEIISLESLTLETIKNGVSSTAAKLAINDFKELVLEKSDKTPVMLSEFLTILIPELTAEKIKVFFEEDFTAFIHVNDKGAWPGYILKLSDAGLLTQAQIEISQLEISPSLKNIFINDPGAINQLFKNGKVGSTDTHYQVYSLPNAAFNYAWFNNYLILSASYSGLTEALKKL
ncbi:MAG: hypothetical protein AAB456_04225 [Patescibacteria group bacterium]